MNYLPIALRYNQWFKSSWAYLKLSHKKLPMLFQCFPPQEWLVVEYVATASLHWPFELRLKLSIQLAQWCLVTNKREVCLWSKDHLQEGDAEASPQAPPTAELTYLGELRRGRCGLLWGKDRQLQHCPPEVNLHSPQEGEYLFKIYK